MTPTLEKLSRDLARPRAGLKVGGRRWEAPIPSGRGKEGSFGGPVRGGAAAKARRDQLEEEEDTEEEEEEEKKTSPKVRVYVCK